MANNLRLYVASCYFAVALVVLVYYSLGGGESSMGVKVVLVYYCTPFLIEMLRTLLSSNWSNTNHPFLSIYSTPKCKTPTLKRLIYFVIDGLENWIT